jgi:hypothetical protein
MLEVCKVLYVCISLLKATSEVNERTQEPLGVRIAFYRTL